MKPQDNQSNMQNPNKGTSGTNTQHDQNQGNKGKQLNPNQGGKTGGKPIWSKRLVLICGSVRF
jgi:hypothetical protein